MESMPGCRPAMHWAVSVCRRHEVTIRLSLAIQMFVQLDVRRSQVHRNWCWFAFSRVEFEVLEARLSTLQQARIGFFPMAIGTGWDIRCFRQDYGRIC